MNRNEQLWRTDLDRLRSRLDRLEDEHLQALESIRLEIQALESRMAASPSAVDDDEVETVKPQPVNEEPTEVIAPPPLPPPLRVVSESAPQVPTPPRPEARDGSFELQFGRVWLVRLGIVLLLSGMVLLGNFAYKSWIHELPNGMRLTGLFIAAGILIELGRRLTLRPSLKRPGEVILAGGLAFFYYCTFAAHQVERLRVIENPVTAAVFLLGSAAVVAAVSWLRQAQATAVLGLLLASYSTMLQPIGWLSCVSSTLLAAAGLLCMSRPGWTRPGIAAMAGTYAAFLGWQLLGAAGGDLRDPAVLWFLPPVWAMFSLPGLLGRFRESMSGRARAWFTGGNNASFFLLFSGLWLYRYESENYWAVCAIFGLLLILMGILGRRANEIAGGVNLSQGLGLMTLALVLKLEGYHLALGLSLESLLLALAFAKFKARAELAFSFLAALGATALVLMERTIPVWSAGVSALLLAGASVVLVRGAGHLAETWRSAARTSASLVFFLSVAATVFGWSTRLADPWDLLAAAAISTLLTASALHLDRSRRMPELAFGSLVFAAACVYPGILTDSSWALGFTAAMSFISSVLWHRHELADRENGAETDLRFHSEVPAWVFSVATVAAVWAALDPDLRTETVTPWLSATAVGLIAIAIATRTKRLASCAGLLGLLGMLEWAADYSAAVTTPLVVGLVSVGGIALLAFPAACERLGIRHRDITAVLLRVTAFLAACYFCWNLTRDYFGDAAASIAILLTTAGFVFKRSTPAEAWGLIAVASVWLLMRSWSDGWSLTADPSWRGAGVSLGLLLLASRRIGMTHEVPSLVGGLACGITSMWATQMLVMRHEWDAVSVLWTLLGFAAVIAGLWLRQRVFRQAGFLLLTMALLKLFAVDVWNFNTFMRVVSFMVLGAALILLGLFYNKFATVLKRLMEEETRSGPSP